MSQLGYSLNQLNVTHKERSHGTRNDRKKIFNLLAKQLHGFGFKLKDPKGLKPKHVTALVKHWQEQKLSNKTIKNRMSAIRWWAEKVGKRNVVARSNAEYGIDKVRNSPLGKSKELDMEKHAQIGCPYVKLSLRLQQELGLRREEAIKFNVSYADQGNHIRLKGSWTKGGKPRTLPILKQSQRALLDEIRSFTRSSLIHATDRYVDQMRRYERETKKVGLSKNHGLRHHYARQRYLELTGWQCPANGGPRRMHLVGKERDIDYKARMQISQELGHERFSITYTYLGS
ncbi:phage integrase N-terminal domain-containing protein [Pseudoalteromonas ruthenica]|uniref:phage integrase N-terminal domain-containing protein n=1 Tax=Pseudoalteromonas ruthenica TaxID=151081 RepID=UPI00110BD0C0|nr:phage integrase N-terminal domain-containing protein [Pseudoalteromonas ruthenica]TMO46443.1 integrase [Pseudoalteromonas ruthenica]TMO50386.1 integrase [Pseudoalteromonas ruthenica]